MTDYLDPAAPVRHHRAGDPYTEGEDIDGPDDGREPDENLYQDRDLADLVPAWLRTAIEFRRSWWTPVDSLAMAIIALQLFILFIETTGGSLYLDDLRAQAYALNQPFWSFIMGSNGTHFAPLPRILDWVQSRAFPLEHGPAIVVTLIIRLALVVVFWRLIRRIFGARITTLLPLILLVATPALLPGTLWYRQSITIVACTVCMLWALEAQLRWLQLRTRLALVEIGLATAMGVGFYEKAAAIPVILAGFTLALYGRRRRSARASGTPRVLGATIASVLLSSVIVGGFLVIYLTGPYQQGSPGGTRPSLLDILELTFQTYTKDIFPLLLGGPYSWAYSTPYAGAAVLSAAAVWMIGVLTAIALIVAGLRRPSPFMRGLFFLLAWSLPSVAAVAAGRWTSLGLVLATATRVWVDLIPATVLFGALAVLPWEIGACRSSRSGAARADRAALAERSARRSSGSSSRSSSGSSGLPTGLTEALERYAVPPGGFPDPTPTGGISAAFGSSGSRPAAALFTPAGLSATAPVDGVDAPVAPGTGSIPVPGSRRERRALERAAQADAEEPVASAGSAVAGPADSGPVDSGPADHGPADHGPAGSGSGGGHGRPAVVAGPLQLTTAGIATALVFAIILIGSGISTVTYVAKWWDNPTGTYLANMRATVKLAEPYARVLATPLPEKVMPAWVSAEMPTSAPLLLLLRPDLRFNDGDGTARALNGIGQLSPILTGQIASSYSKAFCAKTFRPNSKDWYGLRLTQPALYVAGGQVEIGVVLGSPSRVRVQVQTADGKRLTPQTWSTDALPAGGHTIHYPVPLGKTITGVYVQTDGVTSGCITDAKVWAPLTAGG